MITVGVRELKQNASAVVARAADGEEITVTVRGRAVARIVPLAASGLDRHLASGRARPPARPHIDLPMPRSMDEGPSMAEVLEDQRADRS